jgi:hypothetical protein
MPSGPASPLGEQRVANYSEQELLQAILFELRAIKFMLCKIDGTNIEEVDAMIFCDQQAPSSFPGS